MILSSYITFMFIAALFFLLGYIECQETPIPTSTSTFPPAYPQSISEYYNSIDKNARDDELKKQLHDLINPHRVLTYDEVIFIYSYILSSFLHLHPHSQAYTYIHTYILTYIHTYILTYICSYIRMLIHTYMHMYI